MDFRDHPILTPLDLRPIYWPGVYFYDREVEIIDAVRTSVELYVAAGNQLGKDFTMGFVCLTFFLWPQLYFDPAYVAEVERQGLAQGIERPELRHTRRIVTTSVAEKHLKVLWTEIGKFIDICKAPLLYHPEDNPQGPLIQNNLQLTFASEGHLPIDQRPNYMIGMVAEKPEKFQGHHARYTLFVMDECSGAEDLIYDRIVPWSKKRVFIGNTEASDNFFKRHFRQGNLLLAV